MGRTKGIKNKKIKEVRTGFLVEDIPAQVYPSYSGTATTFPDKPKILPITYNFSNEDYHILRDKINEIIKAITE